MKKQNRDGIVAILVVIALVSLSLMMITAEPEGSTLTNVSITTKNLTAPSSRQDPKGTITTMIISTVQQNIKWKAYVGNVSGTLVLRDADDYAIYEWPSGGSPSGEVYITLNSSVDWDTIQCANQTDIQSLQTALGHSSSGSDNVNNTFSDTDHSQIVVGEHTITASTCYAAYPWVNNSAQTPAEDALFQEVLLMDENRRVIFTSIIDQDTSSYRDDQGDTTSLGANHTYDFQAIVPDFTGVAIATYYFYVEIDG